MKSVEQDLAAAQPVYLRTIMDLGVPRKRHSGRRRSGGVTDLGWLLLKK
jgi:hypothetical protein